jgi:hypothetical protein
LQQAASEVANRGIIRHSTTHRVQALRRRDGLSAVDSLALHWPEYLMEAAELGAYMFLTCAFATMLQHPATDAPDRAHKLGNT